MLYSTVDDCFMFVFNIVFVVLVVSGLVDITLWLAGQQYTAAAAAYRQLFCTGARAVCYEDAGNAMIFVHIYHAHPTTQSA